MQFPRRPSVITRTLLQIGVAMTLILVATTAAVYWTTLKAIEARVLETLSEYSLERSKREALLFRQGEESLRIMQQELVERLATAGVGDEAARFAALLAHDADGAYRSRRDAVDPRRHASTWVSAHAEVTPELRRLVVLGTELTERFYPAWAGQFVSLYVSSPLGFNTGIAPTEPNWVWSLPADYNQSDFEWYRVAAQQLNPQRQAVWTRLQADEVDTEHGDTAYVTLSQPVDIAGRHLATLHLDLELGGLIQRTIASERPGLEHLVVRSDGQLVASARVERTALKRGDFYLQNGADASLRSVYETVAAQPQLPWAGYDPGSDTYIAASRLAGPDWLFVSLLKGADLRKQAFASAQGILWVGVASLALALLVLSRILRRQIVQPLHQFLEMTRRMGAGETGVQVAWQTRDELGQLATSFNRMAARIAERDASLQQLNQELEGRIAARTEGLRQSEERFSRAFHSSHALLAILDLADGRLLDVNAAFLDTFGYPREALLGRPLQELPLWPQGPDAFLNRCREEGSIRNVEMTLHTRKGEPRVILLSADRVMIGHAGCILAAGTDITARKRVESDTLRALEREKELNELKGKFVAMVSHEFRTPLEMILSSTDILSRYLGRLSPEQREKHLGTIQMAVRRMAGMMEDVLLLGRFDAGRLPCQPEDLHLCAWCQRLVRETVEALPEPREIVLELGDFSPMVQADESLLRHIFTNLLSNALKYSAPGEPVRLRVTREGAEAVFEISDHGIGIPPEDHEKLFFEFHRGANVGNRPGTGIGLVIVKRCVELHGGILAFQTRPEGGTTFTVRLPLF